MIGTKLHDGDVTIMGALPNLVSSSQRGRVYMILVEINDGAHPWATGEYVEGDKHWTRGRYFENHGDAIRDLCARIPQPAGDPPDAHTARVKVTDRLGNVSFIHYAHGWRCTSASGTPCAFHYAGISHQRETEFMFDLEDCTTRRQVLALVKKYVGQVPARSVQLLQKGA